MNRKLLAILISFLTIGASTAVFAAPACCATAPKQGTEATNAASSPTGMILTSYEKVSNALAADNLADAQAAARTFAAVADITGVKMECPVSAAKDCDKKKACGTEKKDCGTEKKDCGTEKKDCGTEKKDCGTEKKDCDVAKNCTMGVQGVIEAKNIKEAREQFKLMSAQVIKLAENESGYFVVNCGMAGENADWLQSDQEVRNPYHGSSMLRCGVVKPLEAPTDA